MSACSHKQTISALQVLPHIGKLQGAVLDKADYLGWWNEAKALSFNGKEADTSA